METEISFDKYTQQAIAAATLEFMINLLKTPGGQDAINRKKKELGLK